jgi:hypothetical protein
LQSIGLSDEYKYGEESKSPQRPMLFSAASIRERQKVKIVSVYLKSAVGSTEEDARFKQYEPSLICI